MLTELRIRNYAIIEQLDIKFDGGLITFTGETGAGKSIIIDAVETLLGGRADSTQVRTGAEEANVEAVFRIPETTLGPITEILESEDLLDEPNYITLGREIRLAGRNIARVNGHSVSTSLLRQLGEFLVDVHGQSDHLSLLRVKNHLGLLDRYGLSDPLSTLSESLTKYRKTYKRLQVVERELERLRRAESDAARQSEMFTFQINEIETARLKSGEEELLSEERVRLANAEGLASFAQEALLALDEGTPEEPAAIDLLGRVTDAITGLVRLDSTQAPLEESAQSLFENLADLARNLRSYLESVEFNPKRLDQVEERLSLIQSLKRKYGGSVSAVLDYAANARRQLDEITNKEERMEELTSERKGLLETMGRVGSALSAERQTAAKNLEQAMERELNDLNMSGAGFKVEFNYHPDPDGEVIFDGQNISYHAAGLEQVEFLIAPNPGEGFKPLAKIASGGETSRLMLALKNVLVQADDIPTLIFDEIDQGIGGRVGTIVGQKLWHLARQHQVLCITHLPQLAAFADHHFHVGKSIQAGRTVTQLNQLREKDRLIELAQMLGNVSEGTLSSAQELLQVAEKQVAKT